MFHFLSCRWCVSLTVIKWLWLELESHCMRPLLHMTFWLRKVSVHFYPKYTAQIMKGSLNHNTNIKIIKLGIISWHDQFGGRSVMVWDHGHLDLHMISSLSAVRDEILRTILRPHSGAVEPGFLLVQSLMWPCKHHLLLWWSSCRLYMDMEFKLCQFFTSACWIQFS